MKHKIAVMLIMIMTVTMIFSSFAYAADNSVGIKVEFDKKAYVKGETATATLTLTGMTSKTLSAFQTYLGFNYDIIEFVSAAYCDEITNLQDVTQSIQLVENSNNIIVAYLEYPKGINDSINENGDLKLGEIKFKVKGDSDKDIALNFVGKDYKHIVARPFISTDESAQDAHYDIAQKTPATAKIKNVIAENASATFANNTVTGSINIRLSKGQGAILIAQLYDKATGLTKGTVVKPNLTASENINDITFNNISDKTNLTVKYYLWESFANMKALTTIQPIEVQ